MDRRALILFGLFIGVAAWALVPVSGAGDGFGRGVGAQTEVSLVSLQWSILSCSYQSWRFRICFHKFVFSFCDVYRHGGLLLLL